MPNENPKPRPRFQLHLSTCVVLMVVAGILLAAALTPRLSGPALTTNGPRNDYYMYGWPVRAIFAHGISSESFNYKGPAAHYVDNPGLVLFEWDYLFFRYWLLPNVAAWLGILMASAFACEIPIRRRERKRQEIRL